LLVARVLAGVANRADAVGEHCQTGSEARQLIEAATKVHKFKNLSEYPVAGASQCASKRHGDAALRFSDSL